MLSLLPPQQPEASDPPASVTTHDALVTTDETTLVSITTLLSIADPWRRSQVAAEQLRHLESQITVARQIRRDAVGELVDKHRAPLAEVACHLRLTKTRIEQLAKAARRALDGGDGQ